MTHNHPKHPEHHRHHDPKHPHARPRLVENDGILCRMIWPAIPFAVMLIAAGTVYGCAQHQAAPVARPQTSVIAAPAPAPEALPAIVIPYPVPPAPSALPVEPVVPTAPPLLVLVHHHHHHRHHRHHHHHHHGRRHHHHHHGRVHHHARPAVVTTCNTDPGCPFLKAAARLGGAI